MIVAILVAILNLLTLTNVESAPVTVIPPMPYQAPDEHEWDKYKFEAYWDYADEFTALFNSYETKRAKNGRLMIRQGSTGSFKFAKKG